MSMETKDPHTHGEPVDASAGYEKRDVNVRVLLQFGFWMAVVLVITFLGMRWLFGYFSSTQTLGPPASIFSQNERQLPPSPRLQVTPHLDLETYCRGQQEKVETYAWVDRNARVVRIPVDRAVDLVLQRGMLAARSGSTTDGITNELPPPPVVPGGADLQGPCGYLAPEVGSASTMSGTAEK